MGKGLALMFGFLMFISLIIGVVFIFISIFYTNELNIRITIAGWVGYFLFGHFCKTEDL